MLELFDKLEPYAAAALVAIAIATPIVNGLEAAAAKYLEHAHSTPDPDDDARAEAVVSGVGKVVIALAWVTKFLPRFTRGGK